MWRLIHGYLERLPGAVREVEDPYHTAQTIERCVYTPHSLRATTAALLLDAGVDITSVQEPSGVPVPYSAEYVLELGTVVMLLGSLAVSLLAYAWRRRRAA